MEFKSVILTFDLETGGLSADKHPITEIACCPIGTDLVELKEYDSIIAPYDESKVYTEGALKANGMTMEQINSGVDSKIVIDELCTYFNSLKRGREKPILTGHNIIKFDIPFLVEFFKFHKKDFFKFVNENFMIDTMWWGRMAWQESQNYKLSTCCSNAGIELVDAHRAVNDTRSNKELVKYFINNLRTVGASETKGSRFRETFQF